MTTDGAPAAAPVTRLWRSSTSSRNRPQMANRLTYYLIRMPEEDARSLADAIVAVKERIILCSQCYNIADTQPCAICSNPNRDRSRICVVEEALDVVALERTGSYRGLYHVLHGVISPMNGIGPDDLRIRQLLPRLDKESVREVILATNPNLEGEATSMYIQRLIAPLVPRVTRPARGLPVGGDLEYADVLTLGRAIEGRQDFE